MANIGIDLGTTTSEVARLTNKPEIIEVHGQQITPSVVAVDEDGNMIVGQAAKDHNVEWKSVAQVKRKMGTSDRFPLGGKSYTAPEISAMILKELKQAAEERMGEPVDGVVITTPAYFDNAQNVATLEAAKLAGMENVRLFSEPLAAACAYSAQGSDDFILVYDLGGGTFDVAVVDCNDFMLLGIDGNNYLGGTDFDRRLIDHVLREVKKQHGVEIQQDTEAMQTVINACEKAKKELSERESTRIGFFAMVGDKTVKFSMTIRREEFEELIMDLVDQTMTKVSSAIERAVQAAKEKDISFGGKDDLDEIVLVGGSTYVPLVQRKVKEYFGREPSKRVNPDLAVALGAAMLTGGIPATGLHIKLRGVPLVTNQQKLTVNGKTSPDVKVDLSCGVTHVHCQADEKGRFAIDIELEPNRVNDVVATVTDSNGEQRRVALQVRHDSSDSSTSDKDDKVVVINEIRDTVQRLPHALGFGYKMGEHSGCLSILLEQSREYPCSVSNKDCHVEKNPSGLLGALVPIYEGDIPYGPLNTLLGSLTLTAPTGANDTEPVEVTFTYTEDRVLTVTAGLVNYPDRMVTSKLKCVCSEGDKLNVILRAERVLNQLGGKMRPEEKAKISKGMVALADLCKQYNDIQKRSQQFDEDRFVKIVQVGMKLKEDLNQIDAAYG